MMATDFAHRLDGDKKLTPKPVSAANTYSDSMETLRGAGQSQKSQKSPIEIEKYRQEMLRAISIIQEKNGIK